MFFQEIFFERENSSSFLIVFALFRAFNQRMKSLLVPAILLCSLASIDAHSASGQDVLGKTPPEWNLTNWINSDALDLKGLRGKVVLIRWWTAPGCPYCRATAPALNQFHEHYGSKGLQVVGIYHHKASTPLDVKDVKQFVERFGFKFPVAIDPEWQTLKKWWLDEHRDGWTSISILLDRKGVIRYVHPGGQYIKGDAAHTELQSKIEAVLAEP